MMGNRNGSYGRFKLDAPSGSCRASMASVLLCSTFPFLNQYGAVEKPHPLGCLLDNDTVYPLLSAFLLNFGS